MPKTIQPKRNQRLAISILSLCFCHLVPCGDAFAQSSIDQPRKSTDDFVVATWNLEWFFDEYQEDNFSKLAKEQSAPSRTDWAWKRDAVADAIAELRPDVVAFQEIEGQRALFYLTRSIESRHQAKYRVGFVEGTDYYTEQDVGFLTRSGSDLTRIARYEQSRTMFESAQYSNVSKHAEAVCDVPVGNGVEKVTIVNVHFRAGSDNASTRTKQARLVHAWLAERIANGENIIVLGDTNSDETSYPPLDGTDIAALAGLETPQRDDDLIDLGQYLSAEKRRTHLLPNRHFDRILVSRSLVEDDPNREDLVFHSIARREDLSIRGKGIDPQDDHWNGYWKMSAKERDISDHWPVVAVFRPQ
jgi:endonuclease/exonuclease/phosphatase family metal-dependent hydrolase